MQTPNDFPAYLGGVSGYGHAELVEANDGAEAQGQFTYNTIDFWTLKEHFVVGRRCDYRGLLVNNGAQYIANAEVVITAFNQNASSLTFRVTSPPTNLRQI